MAEKMNDKVLDYATKLVAYRQLKAQAAAAGRSMIAAKNQLGIDAQLDAEEWAERLEKIAAN